MSTKKYFYGMVSKKRLLVDTNSEELRKKVEYMGEVQFSSLCG